ELFPLPLVAIVALLLVLIVLTPNLASTGQPTAGSLETEAELVFDHPPTANVTHFYIHGIGTVRYSMISYAIAPDAPWPAPPTPSFHFGPASVLNATLEAAGASAANPIAINVSATYVDASGSSARFWGIFEFNLTAAGLYAISYLPTPGGVSFTPLDALPLTFLLEIVPASGGP
ncbi:MAG TPA: hypothetical protein VGV64_00920, partial [Thermoplasmata archaeon]|nr:hypothetical protein [Thermoplasmata archaeon]